MQATSPLLGQLRRAWRGLHSLAAGLAFPLGGWWLSGLRSLRDPARLAHGLTVVLPGVEGWGPLNWSIARGLDDAGLPGAIIVHDWTTGFWPLFPFHLRARRRNHRRAAELARLILDYQDRYPGRPVHLVGHSGGGAVAVWAMEALPPGHSVSTAVLLGPALSPSYRLGPALRRVKRAMWSFWSPLDLVFLAAGTFLFGTADGRHTASAGLRGFSLPPDASAEEASLYWDRLRQRCYAPRMLGQFHWGGHFGWANRVFVAEEVAPLLHGGDCDSMK
jgi:pimeloyl-ACP methyl ester carboxylesterase